MSEKTLEERIKELERAIERIWSNNNFHQHRAEAMVEALQKTLKTTMEVFADKLSER